jgi:hypothetical protein
MTTQYCPAGFVPNPRRASPDALSCANPRNASSCGAVAIARCKALTQFAADVPDTDFAPPHAASVIALTITMTDQKCLPLLFTQAPKYKVTDPADRYP